MRLIAEELPHPTKANLSLWDATRDSGTLYGKHGKPMEEDVAEDVKVGLLGGIGSDYAVFTGRIGVSCFSSFPLHAAKFEYIDRSRAPMSGSHTRRLIQYITITVSLILKDGKKCMEILAFCVAYVVYFQSYSFPPSFFFVEC
jgi:hypothetical protein